MNLDEISLQNIKKRRFFNSFLKNHNKILFSSGANLASKTQKKYKQVSVSYLVPVILDEIGLKKFKKSKKILKRPLPSLRVLRTNNA